MMPITKIATAALAFVWIHSFAPGAVAFQTSSPLCTGCRSTFTLSAVARTDDDRDARSQSQPQSPHSIVPPSLSRSAKVAAATLATAASLVLGNAGNAWAVSGGGLDYAGLDLSGQDFSNGNYKGKDFTQTLARGTTFANSNLQGCRFFKAYLINTDFEGADVRGVTFEFSSMDDANLKDVNAKGAYFGQSLLDVKTLENGDFTDASVPVKTLIQVCERDDVKGTNPVTGVDTRESLMCL